MKALSLLFIEIKTAIYVHVKIIHCMFFLMFRKVVCECDWPVRSVNEKQVSASSNSLQCGKLLEVVL